MEPFSAIVLLAAKHGVGMVVSALVGDDKVGGAAGELFAALTATESRIDERLAGIEAQLSEMVQQEYTVSLGDGTRYLFEAGLAVDGARRAADLEQARSQFFRASTAARSSLQRATAERYQLLISIATGRLPSAVAALPELEALILDAALEAKHLSVRSAEAADRMLRRQGAGGLLGRNDRSYQARMSVQQSAKEALRLTAGMLSEAAVLAQVLGLTGRLDPLAKTGRQLSRALAGCWDLEAPFDGGRIGNVGCRFAFKGWQHRVGPLKMHSYPITAELTFDPPLQRPVVLQVRMAEGPPRTQMVDAGVARVEVPFDGYTDQLTDRAQQLGVSPHEQVDALITFQPQHFEPWRPGMWRTGA